MAFPRVIPVLLLENDRLVKTIGFRESTYVGDPRNAVKIFNDRGADELLVLDILATVEQREPNYALIEDIVSEAFMPVAYGGGVRSLDAAKRVVDGGVEKIVLGTAAVEVTRLVEQLAATFGSSSTVVCIDVRRPRFGKPTAVVRRGRKRVGEPIVSWAREVVRRGAGEIIVQSVDRDGSMAGYDLPLIREVSDAVEVPVVACGGARTVADLVAAVDVGAAAAAAGSMFVFRPPHRAVLISYPDQTELDTLLRRSW
ncbi:MAG: AglZ/HisF2 family acetamidino modification protein [Gemmatimonadaceae bacterium]